MLPPIEVGQPAPDFTATDSRGQTVHLADLRGRYVLLTFQRNAGCPICNVRFHNLEQQAAHLKAENVVVLAVYESSAATLSSYLAGQPTPYTQLLADPEQRLYQLYKVERSTTKMLSGFILHGGISKVSQSKQLTATLPKQDGNANRIGADFLIGPDGHLVRVHYHRYLGDDLPLTNLLPVAAR
ncbi:MAG: redoxin domain-containing protein [Janthinobacterium lividum]